MKRGIPQLTIGISLILTAIGLWFYFFAQIVSQFEDKETHTFLAPDEITIPIEEPGRYYLWHHHQTTWQGTVYNQDPQLPHGTKIQLFDTNTQSPLTLQSNSSFSSSTNGSTKQSIGYVEFSTPTEVSLTISELSQPAILSFSPSEFPQFFTSFFLTLGVGSLSFFAGVGFSIWGVIVLCSAPKPTPPSMPPIPQVKTL